MRLNEFRTALLKVIDTFAVTNGVVYVETEDGFCEVVAIRADNHGSLREDCQIVLQISDPEPED